MEKQNTFGVTRQLFLRVSTGLAAVLGFGLPKTAHAENNNWHVTLIDLTLCNGCPGSKIPGRIAAC